VRVDRPDPADESVDVGITGNARRSDEPDAPGKDLEKEASSEVLPDSSPTLPDAVSRSERSLDYRARVDAVYRQYDAPYCPVSELKGDEPRTAERLMESPEFTGENLRGFQDTDNPDFIDDYKRTYDAVAGPTAWASPRLNMARMMNQIQRHIYDKDGIDFTVLDLTGASGAQIDEVFKSLDKWTSNPEMHPKSKLIILGGGY
jgi:hypothetical protein